MSMKEASLNDSSDKKESSSSTNGFPRDSWWAIGVVILTGVNLVAAGIGLGYGIAWLLQRPDLALLVLGGAGVFLLGLSAGFIAGFFNERKES